MTSPALEPRKAPHHNPTDILDIPARSAATSPILWFTQPSQALDGLG
jgi:hypothetical protein